MEILKIKVLLVRDQKKMRKTLLKINVIHAEKHGFAMSDKYINVLFLNNKFELPDENSQQHV